MTCVIALRLRDQNGPRLALQVPLFPEAAFPGDTLSGSENRMGLYLETNGIYEMVRNYIKNSDDGRRPYITPLNAESHANLPPTVLVTNGFDPLRDVGHAYAQKLAAAGNDLTYVHNPDLTHGFRNLRATLAPATRRRWSSPISSRRVSAETGCPTEGGTNLA